jgi:hypothetical protein
MIAVISLSQSAHEVGMTGRPGRDLSVAPDRPPDVPRRGHGRQFARTILLP